MSEESSNNAVDPDEGLRGWQEGKRRNALFPHPVRGARESMDPDADDIKKENPDESQA